MRVEAARYIAFDVRESVRSFLVVKRNHQNAVHDRNAEERDETDRRGDAEVETGNVERQYAANDCGGDSGKRQEAVAHVVKQAVKQPHDQNEADRHDDLQALLGLLQISELTGPDQAVCRKAA